MNWVFLVLFSHFLISRKTTFDIFKAILYKYLRNYLGNRYYLLKLNQIWITFYNRSLFTFASVHAAEGYGGNANQFC